MQDERHMADVARELAALDEAFTALVPPPGQEICDCGREVEPGEDHSLCYPGMD